METTDGETTATWMSEVFRGTTVGVMRLASIMKSEALLQCIQVAGIVVTNQQQARQQAHVVGAMNPHRQRVLRERCSSLNLTVLLDHPPRIPTMGD